MSEPADLQPSPAELYHLAECGLFAKPWKHGEKHLRFYGSDHRFGVCYARQLPLPWSVYFPRPDLGETQIAHAADLETVLAIYACLTVR